LSAKNQAFQIVFPSFLSAIAAFLAVLVGVSVVRRRKATSTLSTLSRILIAGPCLVVLWFAGFFVVRSMMERHAYWEIVLAGVFVVALLFWVFRQDSSKRQ
jgi:hypothetical protein